MQVIRTNEKLEQIIQNEQEQGRKVGFVPTLGALHQGHMSLIQQAKEKTDVVVCSIFVNPTQFDDKSDFEKYPKTIDQDIELLTKHDCDILYLPTVDEVYPTGTALQKEYQLGKLEHRLEGATRPGHYQGVAQVVHRLLVLVHPDVLFLGQKDYQQVLIIKKMIKQENLTVEVEICPIVREEDGLAMSSRNRRLSPEARAVAPELFKTLSSCQQNYKDFSVAKLKQWAETNLNVEPLITVDYIEFCDMKNLKPINRWSDAKHVIVLGAIFLQPIRLIDNIILY